MIGLAILFFFAIYLAVSFGVTRAAVGWARRNHRRPWLWGSLAAFAMYNLVFWDLIPTLILHKYYCETQAGFWVYKTPEQWEESNPGIYQEIREEYQQWAIKYLEQWKINHPGSRSTVIEDMLNKNQVSRGSEEIEKGKTRYWLNHRLYYEVERSYGPFHGLAYEEQVLVDEKTNEILLKEIDFSRGKSGNVFGVGGTPDELRQALVLGWGNRTCGAENTSFSNQFSSSVRKFIR